MLSNFIFDNVLTRKLQEAFSTCSCDLLSNFIFDNVLTRNWRQKQNLQQLWFAFKFYLWQRSYKLRQKHLHRIVVVICFQILSLTTFLQVSASAMRTSMVVICFQILSLTTFLQVIQKYQQGQKVVICFQILSLTTFLQENNLRRRMFGSCDLLSNFIFDNVLTRGKRAVYLERSCDLLSNFIFDNVLTRQLRSRI